MFCFILLTLQPFFVYIECSTVVVFLSFFFFFYFSSVFCLVDMNENSMTIDYVVEGQKKMAFKINNEIRIIPIHNVRKCYFIMFLSECIAIISFLPSAFHK